MWEGRGFSNRERGLLYYCGTNFQHVSAFGNLRDRDGQPVKLDPHKKDTMDPGQGYPRSPQHHAAFWEWVWLRCSSTLSAAGSRSGAIDWDEQNSPLIIMPGSNCQSYSCILLSSMGFNIWLLDQNYLGTRPRMGQIHVPHLILNIEAYTYNPSLMVKSC